MKNCGARTEEQEAGLQLPVVVSLAHMSSMAWGSCLCPFQLCHRSMADLLCVATISNHAVRNQ